MSKSTENETIVIEVNKDLKKADDRVYISYGNEELDGKALDDYGVKDTSDIKLFALHLLSIDKRSNMIIKEYFDFHIPESLLFRDKHASFLRRFGLTREDLSIIEKVLLSHVK